MVTDFMEPTFAERHFIGEPFNSNSTLLQGLINRLVFLALADFVVVGSVDEHGESVWHAPVEVDGGAGNHVLFQIEDEGFLRGHVLAEVAVLEFEEDGEFGLALWSVLMPTPKTQLRPSHKIGNKLCLFNPKMEKCFSDGVASQELDCFK